MLSKRVIFKKLVLTLACGIILGFLLGRVVYKPVVSYRIDPTYNALPSVDLSETELWDVIKELEYHIDNATKLYNRLSAIESKVIEERLKG